MKIRHPVLIKGLGLGAAWALRLWLGTVRFRYRSLAANLEPTQPGLASRYIYALWHENLLLGVCRYASPELCVLISQHADGQLIAEVCRHLRFRLVRGSTTRGGIAAVRRLVRASRRSHLVITPDGPRGPRRQVQAGLIYVAARTGLPIVPAGIGVRKAWRLRTWDRLVLPRPWTVATVVTGDPIVIPPAMKNSELEHYRRRVEKRLVELTAAAHNWANNGNWSVVSSP